MGLVPLIAPLFQVRPIPFTPPAAHAVLVTSGNALPALPASLHHVPLLAVGDRTAARARAAGFRQVVSADGDAAALTTLTRHACPPGATLLLATGQGQGGALATALRDAGFRVHRRVVYATTPVRCLPEVAAAALADERLRAILFLSAETARIFRRLVPDTHLRYLGRVDALTIADASATVISDLPWRRVLVSGKPTLERVLALL